MNKRKLAGRDLFLKKQRRMWNIYNRMEHYICRERPYANNVDLLHTNNMLFLLKIQRSGGLRRFIFHILMKITFTLPALFIAIDYA